MRQALGGIKVANRARGGPVMEDAEGDSIPAPTEGWDALSPIAKMKEARALTLDNLFPQPGYIEIRRGHKEHAQIPSVSAPVESVMAYHAADSADDTLFAAAGTGVYDVTTSSVTTALSGLANARWQHLNVSTTGGYFLWMCNGADTPRYFDGASWASAVITGITAEDVIHCALYSERIWMVIKDEISPAYLATDAIQGAATVFDLSGVFSKGGYLAAIGTWSRDGGAGPDDYIAFLTSKGEVAIYSGDPSGTMALAGVYEVGSPLGRRCLKKVGPDLALICVDGVLPISQAINTDRAAVLAKSLTALIQPVMNQSARDWGANFGWEIISYPRGTRAVLNVPVTEGIEQRQYVMNTVTGAWCRFLRENANCWEVFQDRLFYGGNSGAVIEADAQGFDHDGAIEFDMETAFNYLGKRGRLKSFEMCRTLLTSDGLAAVGIALNVDFGRLATVNSLSFPSDPLALWDVALWDAGLWSESARVISDWVGVEGQGFACSVRIKGSLTLGAGGSASDAVTFRVNGFDLIHNTGAWF